MAMEVVTTTDKDQRDRLFEDLRKNGNELERQVVKFSGVEPVLDIYGNQRSRAVQYDPNADKKTPTPPVYWRLMWRSNWSVAYPAS
jgi:hypothetical protein